MDKFLGKIKRFEYSPMHKKNNPVYICDGVEVNIMEGHPDVLNLIFIYDNIYERGQIIARNQEWVNKNTLERDFDFELISHEGGYWLLSMQSGRIIEIRNRQGHNIDFLTRRNYALAQKISDELLKTDIPQSGVMRQKLEVLASDAKLTMFNDARKAGKSKTLNY